MPSRCTLPPITIGRVEAGVARARRRRARSSWSCRACRRPRCRYFMRISSASISARGITGMLELARAHDLGVRELHGRRDHDARRRRARRASASVTERDRRAEALEAVAVASLSAKSEPLTGIAERQQHLGDAAHADAADADEVDVGACAWSAPSSAIHASTCQSPAHRALRTQRVDDGEHAALGGIRARELPHASAHLRRAVRVARRARVPRPRAARRRLVIEQPCARPPCATNASALRALVVVGRVGVRHEDRGQALRGELGDRRARRRGRRPGRRAA